MQNHVTIQGLAALTRSFPALADLAVSIARSSGDAAEIACYKLIGDNRPQLHRLTLMLDCSPPRLIQSSGQHDKQAIPSVKPYPSTPVSRIPPSVVSILDQDRDRDETADDYWRVQDDRNGHVYDIFINSALNAFLARDIFSAVGGNVDTLYKLMEARICHKKDHRHVAACGLTGAQGVLPGTYSNHFFMPFSNRGWWNE